MTNEKDVQSILKFALTNPEEYWSEVANLGFWFKPWTQTLDSSNKPIYRWFVGGESNICYNLLDRQVVSGNGDKIAAICESSATRTTTKITYNDLLNQVSKFADVLQKLGVVKGDVVLSYMPNILELTIAILATWRIGGVVLSPLPNTTSNALADRIKLSKPKIFITSNATMIKNDLVFFKKPLDEAIQKLNYNAKVVVFQRKEFEPAIMDPERDILWDDVIKSAELTKCIPIESTQASLISCSSGTTGKPKGITFSTGGFVTLLYNRIHMEKIFGHTSANITLIPSHPGWLTGIFGIFGPMIDSKCGIIYDGDGTGNGDADTLYRIIRDHKVSLALINAPTLKDLRLAVQYRLVLCCNTGLHKSSDPDGEHAKKYDLSSIQEFYTGGELLDPLCRDWAENVFKHTLCDGWGQTEGPQAKESKQLLENKQLDLIDRQAKFPPPVKIFDEEGKELSTGETGFIAAKLPLPPSAISTLYQDDDLFIKEYFEFPGYFNTKDLGWMDKNGGLHIVGRGDDVMKVSAVIMTTTETENAILKDENIAECVVVPLKHTEMYMAPIAFYNLKKGVEKQNHEILEKMQEHVKECFGPAVTFNYALQVKDIPKTVTGKLTKKVLQQEMQKLIKEVSNGDNPETVLQKMREAAINIGML